MSKSVVPLLFLVFLLFMYLVIVFWGELGCKSDYSLLANIITKFFFSSFEERLRFLLGINIYMNSCFQNSREKTKAMT